MALSKRRYVNTDPGDPGSVTSHEDPFLKFGDYILEIDNQHVNDNRSLFLKFSHVVKKFARDIKELCQIKNENPVPAQVYFEKVGELKNEFETKLDELGLFQIPEYTMIRDYFAKIEPDDFNTDPKNGVLYCWIYQDWRLREGIWNPYHDKIKEEYLASMAEEENSGIVGYISGIFKPALENGSPKTNERQGLLDDQKKKRSTRSQNNRSTYPSQNADVGVVGAIVVAFVSKYPIILPLIVSLDYYQVDWYYQVPLCISATYALMNIETPYDKQVKKAIVSKPSKERSKAMIIVATVTILSFCAQIYIPSFNKAKKN
jgi:hypothetical protein